VGRYQEHITGDEKGQAQIFLDRIFQAFAQPGRLDAGGTTEPAQLVHLIGLYMLPVSI